MELGKGDYDDCCFLSLGFAAAANSFTSVSRILLLILKQRACAK